MIDSAVFCTKMTHEHRLIWLNKHFEKHEKNLYLKKASVGTLVRGRNEFPQRTALRCFVLLVLMSFLSPLDTCPVVSAILLKMLKLKVASLVCSKFNANQPLFGARMVCGSLLQAF